MGPFTLRLLGGVSLEGRDGPLTGRIAQRRRLALLAILGAAPGRPVSRDRVVGLLWPESGSEEARHSLSDTLYVVRQALGDAAVAAVGADLRLDPHAVRTDLAAFEGALSAGEIERAAEAYGGPFLDGFHLDGATEFERWADGERERLAASYTRALEALAGERGRAGDAAGAALWLRRLAAHLPYDRGVVVRLMEAMEEAGEVAGALRHARAYELLIREELGIEPDAEVRALAERIRSAPRVPPALPSRPLVRASASDAPAPAASVAVLPFVDMSGDADGECFADGMTEELIHALAGVPGLRVAARTSAFAFRNRNEDVRGIARALGVAAVCEGSLRRSGRRLRITAQLIDAADGFHLWSGTFDRDSGDLLATQEEIARAVVTALRDRLGAVEPPAAHRPPADSRAHALYLLGLGRMWSEWSHGAENFERAIALFEEALAMDPSYAAAHAGLASTWLHMGTHQRVPEAEAYARARAAALRAFELDPSLPQTHAVLGHVRLYAELDCAGSEAAYRRAIELAPSLPEAHQGYAWLLAYQGRREEAVREAERGWELDPLSPAANAFLATTLLWTRNYARTVEQCEHALAADPRAPFLHQALGVALFELGEPERANAALDRAVEMLPGHPILDGSRGHARARTGGRDAALEIVRGMERAARDPETEGMACVGMAMVWAGLGEMDRAFDSLRAAIDLRSPWILALGAYPEFDPLRADPRFAALAAEVGLGAR